MNAFKYLLAAAAALWVGQANAATVDIVGVSGTWTSVTPSASGVGTDTIKWGTPATGSGKSGYSFDSAATPIDNVFADTEVGLGIFDHFNNPITGSSITAAVLQVVIDLMVDGVSEQAVSVFNFSHWETSNNPGGHALCANGEANYSGININGCADRVVAALNLGSSTAFSIDGNDYLFTISGFKVGSNLLTEFWTKENSNNYASLVGSYTLKSNLSPVPLPAAAPLLLAAVGGLGLVSRRRRRS